jgi:hypothetical protein
MTLVDELQKANQPVANKPLGYQLPQQPQAPGNWVSDLINQHSQLAPRQRPTPEGFQFQRSPFDTTSYYNQINAWKNISKSATAVTETEAANRAQAQQEALFNNSQAAMQRALDSITNGGANPNGDSYVVTHDNERNYGLKKVAKDVASAANYFGSKYGIKSIGGYASHGSVPGSDHPKGLAIDLMINNIKQGKATGTAMANDIVKNYKAWNVKYVIWYHYIWTPSAGWHKYSGPSPHTDHVHVSFNS